MWWFGYHLLSTPRRVERPAAVSGLTRRQPWADLWLLLVFVPVLLSRPRSMEALPSTVGSGL